MENRERNYLYVVPFIGGILCIVSVFVFNISVFISSGLIGLIALFILVHPDIVLGIMMIVSAIKMRSGKTTWIEQKKELLVISWILVSITLGFTIFTIVIIGQIAILFEYAFVGGLLTLIGYYYDRYTTKRNYVSGPAPMKGQIKKKYPKFCTNCGIGIKVRDFKFCPNCGNQLTPEKIF